MSQPRKVVTYQSPRGGAINVCPEHEAERKASAAPWWKDWSGEEYCQVSHGLHRGMCDVCEGVLEAS